MGIVATNLLFAFVTTAALGLWWRLVIGEPLGKDAAVLLLVYFVGGVIWDIVKKRRAAKDAEKLKGSGQ